MKRFKLQLLSLLLVPIGFFMYYLFSVYPYTSESFYSLTLNKLFIRGLSELTGILPFSLAEFVLYFFILLCLIYPAYTLWNLIYQKGSRIKILMQFFLNTLSVISILYFLFLSMWGLNYLRPRFGENIGIHITEHSTAELAELYAYLIEEINTLSEQTQRDTDKNMQLKNGYQNVFQRAQQGYDAVSKVFPSLGGSYGRPKPVFMSKLMNYTGIGGIYFPFTGEANVNIAALDAAIPAATMHEMAHQRGYANEDESHFIAFLTCSLHPDSDFKYSGYLLALFHTSWALQRDNPALLQELNKNLHPYVLQDIRNNYDFVKSYQGTVEVISTKVNDTYLKANGVSDGEKSYGRMVDLLLSYYDLYIKK